MLKALLCLLSTARSCLMGQTSLIFREVSPRREGAPFPTCSPSWYTGCRIRPIFLSPGCRDSTQINPVTPSRFSFIQSGLILQSCSFWLRKGWGGQPKQRQIRDNLTRPAAPRGSPLATSWPGFLETSLPRPEHLSNITGHWSSGSLQLTRQRASVSPGGPRWWEVPGSGVLDLTLIPHCMIWVGCRLP